MARTAPVGNPIPSDQASPNDLTPIYSQNRLGNANAEKGTLEGWQTTAASIAPGGAKDSKSAFRLEASSGRMTQVHSAQGTQPSDYRIGGYYLPDRVSKAEDVKVKAYVQVEYLYADGTKDIAVVPVRGAIAYDG